MAANRDDEQGVLGNLPRSRPGRRSAKRGGTSATRKPAAAAGTRAKPRATRTSTNRTAQRPAPAAPPRKDSGDPIGHAVQIAAKVAAVGLKTAAGIVKRLPRP